MIKLIKRISVHSIDTILELRVYDNKEFNEWQARIYVNGTCSTSDTYFTDCKADAIATGKVMLADKINKLM